MYFLGGNVGRCVRLTTLPPSCAVVMKCGNLNFLEPSGLLQACNGTALIYLLRRKVIGDMRRGHSGPQSFSGCFGQNKYFLSIPGIELKCKAFMYRNNLCLRSAMTSWKVVMILSVMLFFFHLPSHKAAVLARR
jgi:hypothetical protein